MRPWRSVLAYSLGDFWRRLVLPRRIDGWSLTNLVQRRVKTGGQLVKHAQYYGLLLAESHPTRRLFGSKRSADLLYSSAAIDARQRSPARFLVASAPHRR